jgi:adenosylcobyric acid synthase
MDTDFVNLRVAQAAQAQCLLVADIDRGGAFAHLYGTWALLPPADRAALAGFVLNRFRGDPALLHPGPHDLQQLTGLPTLAVLPMLRGHGLPEEDGAWLDAPAPHPARAHAVPTVAVLAYPRISNLDEFTLLAQHTGCRMRWARSVADCAGADWLVLPGSKHTLADLAWLRAQGLDAVIAQHAQAGRPVLGLCGGLQMLGEAIVDPDGLEGGPAVSAAGHNGPGLGVLLLVTRFAAPKTVRATQARFTHMPKGPFAALQGLQTEGYEIHLGTTVVHPAAGHAEAVPVVARDAQARPLAWCHPQGHVLGAYVHGLLEDARVLQALWPAPVGQSPASYAQVFDRLADNLQAHFSPGSLQALCGLP